MKRLSQTWTVIVALAASQLSVAGDGLRVKDALASLVDDVHLSSEVAGVIKEILVVEGSQVKAGDVVGRIQDSQPRAERQIALAEQQSAKTRASTDVSIRYAKAAYRVAEKEYILALEANRKVAQTKAGAEVDKLWLTSEQAKLQAEQATHELQVATCDLGVCNAKLAAADAALERTQIHAPLAGTVVEVSFRPGEWIRPGDKLLRLVRLDRLRVDGYVNTSDVSPEEIDKRAVNVEIELAHGRREKLAGQVVFVSPLVQPGGDYLVRAEVVNRSIDGQWVLRPGVLVDMVIQTEVKTSPAQPALATP